MDRHDFEKLSTFRKFLEQKLSIDRMIAFGSRVREDHLLHSDFDVILVSESFQKLKFIERPAGLYQFWPYDEPIELLCYTPDEFERKVNQIGIVQQAANEGMEI